MNSPRPTLEDLARASGLQLEGLMTVLGLVREEALARVREEQEPDADVGIVAERLERLAVERFGGFAADVLASWGFSQGSGLAEGFGVLAEAGLLVALTVEEHARLCGLGPIQPSGSWEHPAPFRERVRWEGGDGGMG